MKVSLPLPVEIVATEISLYDNEGAAETLGVAGGRVKGANRSELRDLQIRRTCWKSVLGVAGRMGSNLVTINFSTPLSTFLIRKVKYWAEHHDLI